MGVTAWTFIVVLILITASGAMSVVRKRKTTKDYLVASRDVPPWLSALSTVATNNSGFMFIGMIAYTYSVGIEAVWMMIGWVLGDLLCWVYVHPRIRQYSLRENRNSLPGLIASGDDQSLRKVVVTAGLISMGFLCVYAAAQLKAGSTALHALFEWDMSIGALVGTAIVILYSYAGGIRADIWTDAAQSFVMIVSMAMILVAGVLKVGAWGELSANLSQQDQTLMNLFPEDPAFGVFGFVLGYMFAGLSVVGQPHIMTRIMALDRRKSIFRAGVFYFAWYIPFFLASIGVGLYCRAIIPELTQLPIAEGMSDPDELALPLLTMRLLPDVFVGLALAGLFAATVSTADSQIIVCSGALTQDVMPKWQESYLASKVGTFSVTAVALAIALFAPEGVFGLVLIAWSALGAALGPLLVLRLFGWPLTANQAMTMMVVAVVVVTAWHLSPWNDDVFKALPGALAAFAIYGLTRVFGRSAPN